MRVCTHAGVDVDGDGGCYPYGDKSYADVVFDA